MRLDGARTNLLSIKSEDVKLLVRQKRYISSVWCGKSISFKSGVCVLVDIFYDSIFKYSFCAFVRLKSPHAKMEVMDGVCSSSSFFPVSTCLQHEKPFYANMFLSDIA